MRRYLLTLLCVLFFTCVASAQRFAAWIVGVDAERRVITIEKGVKDVQLKKVTKVQSKANVYKDAVIREGEYRLGKPARTIEGDILVNGLKNFVLEKASAENPVRVTIYTADEDDAAKEIKKGDVVKILVHPKK